MEHTATICLAGPLQAVAISTSSDGQMERRLNMEEQLRRTQENIENQHAQLDQARRAMESAVVEFAQFQEQFFQEVEMQLVDLAVEIARKVLSQEIEAGRFKIDPVVQQGLSSLRACKNVVVHLHPEDLSSCQLAKESDESSRCGISFVADAGVRRAECLLETPQGVVDSTVQAQLAEICQALKTSQ